jgi:hypothetical protein
MSNFDKRVTPRQPVSAGNYIVYTEGSGSIRDLSLSGVFIEDPEPLPEGTVFGFDLRLGDDLVPVRGVVRRSLPGVGMGVKFLNVARESRDRLERFLAAAVKNSSWPAKPR